MDLFLNEPTSNNFFWSINRRLSIAFACIVTITTVIGATACWSAFQFIDESHARSHSNDVLRQIDLVLSTIQDAETGQRGFVITGDNTYLQPYEAAVAIINQRLARLDELTHDQATQRQHLTQLKALVVTKLEELRTTVALRENNGFAAAQRVILTDQGQRTMIAIREVVSTMQAQENLLLNDHVQQLENTTQRTIWLFGALMIVDLFLLFVIYLVVQRDTFARRKALEAGNQLNAQLEQRISERTTILHRTNVELQLEMAERKVATEAQQHSERQLQAILDNAPIIVYVKDMHGVYSLINHQFERTLRLTKEQVLGKTSNAVAVRLPPNTISTYQNQDQHVLAHNEAVYDEVSILQEDGPHSYISLKFPLTDANGNAYAIGGMLTDITSRKQAEEALRASEQRYRTLIKHFPEGSVMLFDRDMRYVVADGTALEKNGLTKEQIEGRTISEVLTGDSYAVLEPIYAAALRGTATQLDRSYGDAAFSINIIPVHDDDGMIQGGMVVTHDITQRKRAENEVVRLNAELEARVRDRTAQLEVANKELESFSYSVSHDLRSPLRSIDGFSQALLEDYGDQLDALGHDYLQRVRNATKRMAELIDDMLNLSRVARSEMHIEPVDLSALAETVIAELRKWQPARAVEVVITPHIVAKGDAHLLRVLLENLLGNAWKFTSKSGHARIMFGTRQIDGMDVYYVCDNGAGFDMAYANKLFGAFQRLHAITEFEGTGVGLATVQRIVRRHGGTIWAEGQVDAGATFSFSL